MQVLFRYGNLAQTRNSAIRSADPENPTVERNMKTEVDRRPLAEI